MSLLTLQPNSYVSKRVLHISAIVELPNGELGVLRFLSLEVLAAFARFVDDRFDLLVGGQR